MRKEENNSDQTLFSLTTVLELQRQLKALCRIQLPFPTANEIPGLSLINYISSKWASKSTMTFMYIYMSKIKRHAFDRFLVETQLGCLMTAI